MSRNEINGKNLRKKNTKITIIIFFWFIMCQVLNIFYTNLTSTIHFINFLYTLERYLNLFIYT